ncbi:hypothetical protein [Halosolutus halophilus]|nr:hypothetical protein [Halosolutus halophilus]
MTANDRAVETDGSDADLPEATQADVDAAIDAIERDERTPIES